MPPIFGNSRSGASTLPQRRLNMPAIVVASKYQRQAHGRSPSSTQMSSHKWLLTFVLLGLFVAATSAADEKTVLPSPVSPSSTLSSSIVAPRDEIYIDDEGIDGSGGRGELHDDLEKDPDYSGSGFGPDDEDSSTDVHTHHRRPSIPTDTGKSRQSSIDNDLLLTTNTRINNNNNQNNQKTSGTTIIGSGTSSSNSGTIIGSNSDNTIGSTHTTPVHSNTDDFELEEDEDEDHLPAGSGDGGIISRPDDDDHTGDDGDDDENVDNDNDDDNYDDEEEEKRIFQHKVDAGVPPTHESTDSDATSSRTELQTPPKVIHSNTDDDFLDEHDEDDTKATDQFGAVEESDTDDEGEGEDDGTEMYTDVTDPNSSSGIGGTTDKRPGINNQGTIHELDTNSINSLPPDTKVVEHTVGNEVLIMNTSDDDRTTSFFAQPGILAAVIGGAVVGLLCAILVVMFIVYRMRKKDEGSYALDEPKRSPAVNSYAKNANNREFYA